MLPSQSQHDSFAWETSLDIPRSEDRRRSRVKSVYEWLVEKLSLRPLRQTLCFYIKMLPCTKPAPYRDAFPSVVRMNLTGPHGALNPLIQPFWDEPKHRLRARSYHPTSVLDLNNALVSEWELIPAAGSTSAGETESRRGRLLELHINERGVTVTLRSQTAPKCGSVCTLSAEQWMKLYYQAIICATRAVTLSWTVNKRSEAPGIINSLVCHPDVPSLAVSSRSHLSAH